jgi:Arc/MetJ-type ribon-helix-helix transcriptional regulator
MANTNFYCPDQLYFRIGQLVDLGDFPSRGALIKEAVYKLLHERYGDPLPGDVDAAIQRAAAVAALKRDNMAVTEAAIQREIEVRRDLRAAGIDPDNPDSVVKEQPPASQPTL